MAIRHGLGRGLDSLLRENEPAEERPEPEQGALKVPLSDIRVNPRQPRRSMDESSLAELTESVRERGVLQPLLVRKEAGGYELIAGERRLRAASGAGLQEVPVNVVEAGGSASLEIALVENLQRENLNILEEAEGYQALLTDFGLTQDAVAERVGKSRASVANALRVLSLPSPARDHLAAGRLSPGHAKLLAGLEIEEEQLLLAKKTVDEGLSVRNLEKLIRKRKSAPRKPRASREDLPSSHIKYLSDRLHRHFGTAVRINSSRTLANGKKRKGSIEIDFYSNEDLDRILELLGVNTD
ncbi:MAG: ParB/RepB/Spo0J family partition protein [Kiritimatiellia bacterium]